MVKLYRLRVGGLFVPFCIEVISDGNGGRFIEPDDGDVSAIYEDDKTFLSRLMDWFLRKVQQDHSPDKTVNLSFELSAKVNE